MKKRTAALVLALSLAFSLTVPAAGAPLPEPPQLTPTDLFGQLELVAESDVDAGAWLSAHPDEAAAFDPHAYFAEHYGYYDSEEEYMEFWELATQADFETAMLEEWALAQARMEHGEAVWAQTQEDEPEDTARFLAGFDGWFAQEYTWYDSLEEYRADAGLGNGQAMLQLYQEWKGQQAAQAQAQAERDAFITAHGGVPGRLGVMVNGRYLDFGAKAPYAENGVLYVPAGQPLSGFAEIAAEGAFVPLRQTMEAAGWTVEWDAGYDTAVLWRDSSLAGELDRSFTAVNQLMDGPQDGKTHTASGDLDLELTLLNSLDGDETYRFTGTCASELDENGGSFSLELDLSPLATIPGAPELYQQLADTVPDMGLSDAMALWGALKDFSLEGYLQRGEDGGLYLRSPLLPLLFPDSLEPGEWVHLEGNAHFTMGSMLAPLVTAGSWGVSPAERWDNAVEDAQLWVDLMGDSRFKAAGAGWDYTLDLDDVSGICERYYQRLSAGSEFYYDPYAGMDWSNLFRACKIDLYMEPGGAADGSFTLRPDYGTVLNQAMPGTGALLTTLLPWMDFQMDGTYQHHGDRQTCELSYRFKNTLELGFTATVRLGTSDRPAQNAPGKSETVLELGA